MSPNSAKRARGGDARTMIPCLVQIAGIHWKYQRMAHIEKFIWSQLGSVPDQPGIYAWYYSPEITKFDMTKFVEGVKQMSSEGRIAEAQDLIRQLLEGSLFWNFSGKTLSLPSFRVH